MSVHVDPKAHCHKASDWSMREGRGLELGLIISANLRGLVSTQLPVIQRALYTHILKYLKTFTKFLIITEYLAALSLTLEYMYMIYVRIWEC